MTYDSIGVTPSEMGLTITMNRLQHQNSLHPILLKEINQVLDSAEDDPACRIIILEGQKGLFCTGMDFEKISQVHKKNLSEQERQAHRTAQQSFASLYMQTIRRFTLTPKIIISVVDGRVMAGGIGLVAASDLAIATPRSQFSLSEILWGLLPAMVAPYLIRRLGFQMAYRMTLTTLPVSAQEAYESRLIDMLSEKPYEDLPRIFQRLTRLEESTIQNMKNYFRKMWFITTGMEKAAIAESARLACDPKVIENIYNFVKYQEFPWDQTS